MCQQVRWMKNREWVHKRECTVGNWPLFRKGEKREEIYILKQINSLLFEACTTSLWTQMRGKSCVGGGRNLPERRGTRCPFCDTDVAAYISTCKVRPTRAWQAWRGPPAREALQHSVTLLAPPAPRDDISTRWLFWIMRPSGRVRRERGKKSSFSGCLLPTWNRHLFSSAPFAAYAKRCAGVIGEQSSRPACFCSLFHSHLSLFGVERHGVTSTLAPILPKLIPIWPSSTGPSKGGRRQVIDILRCMSFVYVVTLSQGLSPWMTADPVCIHHLIQEPCMSDCSAARGPVAFQQRTFQ